jgi:CBS domain containing-hemolysin-like protein
VGLLIFFFVLSIAFSFLCSILEAVLLSVTPSFINRNLQSGSTKGKLLSEYKRDIDKPLSAILTLNTIAHTVGAIGVGAQASQVFSSNEPVSLFGIMNLSWESIVAAGMTLAILILSEIIPKTIGANNWKSLSGFSVQTIRILCWVLAPFVWVSQLITKTFKNDKNKSVLSRADFAAMTMVGETSGALKKHESLIINNLLNFEQQTVRDIMTPRTVAYLVSEDDNVLDIARKSGSQTFSRIPVYKGEKNNVVGLVLKDDILTCVLDKNGENKKIKDIKREILAVEDSMPLPQLFNKLVKEKQHLFIVRDEFGTLVGIVTLEDLFETLLGQEIVDESDKVIDLQEYARQKFDKDSE